jgi:superfamily II DNA or RNA helicase
MELRYYQNEMVGSIFEKLETIKSVLCQSATGSGKTVIMCDFIKKWIEKNPDNKILVSVHREELVQQTSDTLARFGILNEIITAKSKPDFTQSVFVGMTQTIWSRKYKINIDLMVVDEAHEQIHVKSFDLFQEAKRVGFTATPIINKRITYYECDYCKKRTDKKEICCYNEPTYKWSAPVTMSETYNDIIVGVPIKKLIEEGSLVDEITFTYNYYENLEAKENDDFDENDIAEESVKHDKNVLEEYKEKALGKKTMIFTASTKQNLSLVETFSEHQIKSYDSVNNETSERKEIVEWFRNTDGAILVSTGTFTTGFDVKEVECIIINRPTQSLSLWLQIVGRGARPSDLIFKENFVVIDLGGNVNRLGRWSDNINWNDIFWNGLKKAKKKNPVLIQCQKCDYNWIGESKEPCPDCGHINITQESISLGGEKESETELTDKKTIIISVVPIPNGKKIAEFVRRTTDNKNDYYNILIEKYVDLWKLNRVPHEIYFQRKKTGYLDHKIMLYLKKNYGYVNKLSEGVPRSYDYLLNRIKSKLEKCYIEK